MRWLIGLVFAVAVAAQIPLGGVTQVVASGACSTPSFSPGAGTYGSTQSVTISDSCTTICYNTTGSPTATVPGTCDMGSTTYSGAISVATTKTLYAIGSQLTFTNSSIGSAAYTISPGVSISNKGNKGYPITGCGTSATSCTIPITVANTGDTVVLAARFCSLNNSCLTHSGCTVTASDGTNTYTYLSAASVANLSAAGTFYNIAVLYAKNATAGSYTATISITGTSCVLSYLSESYYDFSGANTTNPIDTGVSQTATSGGTQSASATITSSGNVTNSNEVAVAIISSGSHAITGTGSYSTLQTIIATAVDQDLVGPTSGSATTATATLSANDNWWYSLFAVTP